MIKYVYVALIIALIALGYFAFVSMQKEKQAQEIPEGYHMMEDGTLMRNAAMGTEGMGAMAELQAPAESDPASLESTVAPDVKVFTVSGVNHKFDVTEIKVNKGDTVTINFESTEGFHDWVVDEFDAATDKVQPGTPTSVTFVADEAGSFEYYCSVGSHRAQGMVGTLIVEG